MFLQTAQWTHRKLLGALIIFPACIIMSPNALQYHPLGQEMCEMYDLYTNFNNTKELVCNHIVIFRQLLYNYGDNCRGNINCGWHYHVVFVCRVFNKLDLISVNISLSRLYITQPKLRLQISTTAIIKISRLAVITIYPIMGFYVFRNYTFSIPKFVMLSYVLFHFHNTDISTEFNALYGMPRTVWLY